MRAFLAILALTASLVSTTLAAQADRGQYNSYPDWAKKAFDPRSH